MRRLLNIKPNRSGRLALGLIPIGIALVVYFVASAARYAANPNDKVLPSLDKVWSAIYRMGFQIDRVTGDIPLIADTLASMSRLGWAVGIATAVTLLFGLLLGMLPTMRATFGPLVATIAVIPPIAILPMLMIFLGVGEVAKIALIAIGITPLMLRDLTSHVRSIPEEQMVKAQSLGGSTWQIGLRVALPQAMPRLITAIRLSLGPAWVFLIAAEAIASDVGLGYRIFLVRRYMAMDVIIPYVAWISILAVSMDFALLWLSKKFYPWAHVKGD